MYKVASLAVISHEVVQLMEAAISDMNATAREQAFRSTQNGAVLQRRRERRRSETPSETLSETLQSAID